MLCDRSRERVCFRYLRGAQESPTVTEYRREIDGLRAIAVVAVVLFHAGVPFAEGGFLGVDIFFVISGYLITGIIIRDIDAGTFSLREFYIRRARRIIPALLLVVLVSFIPAVLLMSPFQLKDYGQSLVSVATFSSNIYFWLKSGYFEPSSELSPLLHTWSLAVEEQFYLIFPVVLIYLTSLGVRARFMVLAAVCIASLVCAELLAAEYRSASFYLFPSRAWELLAGAVLARMPAPRPSPAVSITGSLGLVVILVSVVVYHEGYGVPGLLSLPLVAGTMAVITCARAGTFPGRLLGSRLMVGVGLISYSVYLWHQPLLAFTRLKSVVEPSFAVVSVMAMLSFPLGFLTWRFVEQPLRRRRNGSPAPFFVIVTTLGVLVLAVGIGLHSSRGAERLKFRGADPEFQAAAESIEVARRERHRLWRRLLLSAEEPFGDRPQRLLVIGDSMGEDVYVALSRLADTVETFDVRYRRLDDECMANEHQNWRTSECASELDAFHGDVRVNVADTIIVSTAWESSDIDAVRGVVQLLRGRRVIVIGPAAFASIDSMVFAMTGANLSSSEWPEQFARYRHADALKAAKRVEAAVRSAGMIFFDRFGVFCTKGDVRLCSLFDDADRPLIIDQSHTSISGADRLAETLHRSGLLFASDD